MPTVYHIEDHPLVRQFTEMMVTKIKPGQKFVGISKLSALDQAIDKGGPASLFILDLNLPDAMGLSGLQHLVSSHPGVPIVVLTAQDGDRCEEKCIAAGASEFISKGEVQQKLESKLALYLNPAQSLEEGEQPLKVKLTKRQKQLIVMLDLGLSNAQIAEKIQISEHTVKVHLWRFFRLIGVNSRTQALHYARQNGWLF